MPEEGNQSAASVGRIRLILWQFCDYTTAHGLGRFGAQGTTLGRTLWLCFLLGTYSGFTYHMYTLGLQFASVPLSTSLSTSLPFEFPDVYFCPSDTVTMSRVSPQVNIFDLTRLITCDASCKKKMKFDMYWTEDSDSTEVKYGMPALGLLNVISAVEESVTHALHYESSSFSYTCRTTPEGEEYRGNQSTVPLFGSSFMLVKLNLLDLFVSSINWDELPPYSNNTSCLSWNLAAQELRAAGLTSLASKILNAGYSDSERSCRRPPGLPLTAFFDNATRPLQTYIGCLPSNDSTGAALMSFICMPENPFGLLSLGLCAECCYNAAHSYMSLLAGKTCYCSDDLGNATVHYAAGCKTKCPGASSEICGGETSLSVYLVRSRGPKPLFIPFSPTIDSFKVGPYCFYRAASGSLAATYCNVPYCPISSSFDCLSLGSDGAISSAQYLRYTGYRYRTKTRDDCIDWVHVAASLTTLKKYKFNLEFSTTRTVTTTIFKLYIETPDIELYSRGLGATKAANYCRAARVVMDAIVYDYTTNRPYFIRYQVANSATPMCFVKVNHIETIIGTCTIAACSRVTQSIPGLVRDQVGNALLASRFSSSIGIGFTFCNFGSHSCTMNDFTTVLHPALGICHRFNQDKWIELTKDLKATESALTFEYFTDATDSMGRQLPGLGRMGSVVFPGQVDANDDTLSALKVVLVPKGQFPWRDGAITASPGQHLQLKVRFDKLNKFSKPPQQECLQPSDPVTYLIPSWRTGWSFSASGLDSVNLTKLLSTVDWAEKIVILKDILSTVNSSIGPMNETLTFERATQQDCINLYAVKKFIQHCKCLPSFLPVPAEFYPTYPYCFNKTDLPRIEETEKCYMNRVISISRYEKEARPLCQQLCQTSSYSIRPTTYPWPGLTLEKSVQFMQNSLGDWSYPYNFLFSKGVANLFYMDIRSSEVYNRSANISASELLDFNYELDVIEKSLVKVTVGAISDFGQEMTEEQSYTIKNLMADLGGALGLWSGISVLTACELIELLVYLAMAMKRKINPEAAPITAEAKNHTNQVN